MAVKRGLGRGLGALINDGLQDERPAPSETAVRELPVAAIEANTQQPRRAFDAAALDELAASIRERGVLQPLLVRRLGGERYELIAGERRLRAAAAAGLARVPAMVIEAAERDALELALIENVQREDLGILEEAEAYQMLAERYGLTQEQIAERVGKARATVTNALRLLDLPADVRRLVAEGRLSAGHAKVLAGVASPEMQVLYAGRAIEENLSVRNLEKRIEREARPARKPRAARRDIPASHIGDLSDRLHAHFGSAVRLTSCRTYANGKKGKGTIEIDYYSSEDLDRILDVLGITVD